MARVIALQGFDHGGPVRRGEPLTVSETTARALRARGLVSVEEGLAGPRRAAGKVPPSSALPAAPASRKATSNSSGAGAKRRTGRALEPSSS